MDTFAQIIRSLFILTLIGALTYRLFLTLFFLYYHNQYLLHQQTLPAIIYLLISYFILILGLAYMYNLIYDIQKSCRTICQKMVGVCYLLGKVLAGPVVYGVVLWLVGFSRKVGEVVDNKGTGVIYGADYGVSEVNMLRWFQISFFIHFLVFAFASFVILVHLIYKAVSYLTSNHQSQHFFECIRSKK